jgi:hypothetical protein
MMICFMKTSGRAEGFFKWSLVGLAPFLVYLITMAPTVYGLDSAELTTGAWCLGIVHSPGSPLYLLLGHVFTWLPFGDIGFRMNLMSVVAGALGSLFVGLIVYRLIHDFWASVAAAWLLAFSYYYWVWALVAELYAPHACWVAGLLLLMLHSEDIGRRHGFYLTAFLFGLGLGVHMALIVLLPAFAAYILTHASRYYKKVGWLVGMVVSGILGFSIYLYLPLRHLALPALDYVRDYCPGIDLASWKGFCWMVTGKMFSSMYFQFHLRDMPFEILKFLQQFIANFHILGIAIGLIGLWFDFRIRMRLHLTLGCMFFCHVLFFASYGAVDKVWMFSVTYVVWSIWFGLGIHHLANHLSIHFRTFPKTIVPVVGIILSIILVISNFNKVDLSGDATARVRGERVMASVAPDALIVGGWEDVPVLEYLNIVEGKRRDVRVANWLLLGEERGRKLIFAALAKKQPVYTTKTSPLGTGAWYYREIDNSALIKISSYETNMIQ